MGCCQNVGLVGGEELGCTDGALKNRVRGFEGTSAHTHMRMEWEVPPTNQDAGLSPHTYQGSTLDFNLHSHEK